MIGRTMQRILVTGAGGFIGSHLVEQLVIRGYQPRAMVRYTSTSSRGWLDSLPADVAAEVEVVTGDVRDAAAVRQHMTGCDAVAHLAALIGIPYSYVAPDSYVATNVVGTLNIVQAARSLDLARVVHTSTSEVYGTALRVPIDEDHPLQGQSPYSASKIGADQMALSFHRSFGTPVTVVRPFNTYGPRQSLRAIIPTIIAQLVQGDSRLRLGSLHPTRDLTFVTDTARGFIAALESNDAVGQVVNLGSGFEISIADLARSIGGLMGIEVDFVEDPNRLRPEASEVERLWADARRARTLLGWSPERPGLEGLEHGLTQTIGWFRSLPPEVRLRWKEYHV